MNNYEHTIIARQDTSASQIKQIKDKYSDKVIEVRGRGLMKGLLLNFEAAELVSELLKRKVIANAASGNVLRMVPPLIVQKDDIDEFIDKLDESLSAIQNV